MKSFNNDIMIQRGEAFVMGKTVQNKDGSPYIVGAVDNPYWLITVASTRYGIDKDAYILQKFEPVDISFVRTQAMPVTSLYWYDDDQSAYVAVTDMDDLQSIATAFGTDAFFEKIDDEHFVDIDVKDIVVSDTVDINKIKYYRWVVPADGTEAHFVNYTCRIVTVFTSETTRDWLEQNYLYSIRLVCGQTRRAYLTQLYRQFVSTLDDIDDKSDNELYDAIVAKGYEFPSDFRLDAPIVNLFNVRDVLAPTKLTVNSRLSGGNKW